MSDTYWEVKRVNLSKWVISITFFFITLKHFPFIFLHPAPDQYEEVRVELQSVQRELQSVRDDAKAAVTSRERLTQELQTKQAQVCSLEGQLDSARTVNNKLTQEVKRSVKSLGPLHFLMPCFLKS